jgi:hypothetical protein
MLKKSTKNIPIEIILNKFNFIEEGSIFIVHEGLYFLVSCMESQSIMNLREDLDLKLSFNPIMQGDFPTLELKIAFYKNKVKLENISNLVSIENFQDVESICNFFSTNTLLLIVFNKKNKLVKSFKFINKFRDELDESLKNFKIDIKDIIKNNNN